LLVAELTVAGCWLLVAAGAEAVVSKGKDQQLDTAVTNQGGGIVTSSKYRQRNSIGDAMASTRLSGSRFRLLPGFLAASLSDQASVLPTELDLTVLYAKTDSLGLRIDPQTWQRDNDPIFIWEPPPTGPDIAGYSYAVDEAPDDTIDTAGTSLDVATSALKTLQDGKHTFSVKALNSAGNSGNPISLELWIDTLPPTLINYTPAPGALLNTLAPSVAATASDASSGISQDSAAVLVNGQSAAVSVDPASGALSATGSGWKEGTNNIELRIADAVGNAMTPIVWSVVVDTLPPTGTILINADAAMTMSPFVTLGLSASDATSGVARMLLSNEELTGYVEEPYVALRELWKLTPVRGIRGVYVKFVDAAGNVSPPMSDTIDLALLAPETVLTSGPAGFTPSRDATFSFMCPEGECVFSFAFDNEEWSEWSPAMSVSQTGLVYGNHYFRVKAAKDVNGTEGIQPDEEDSSPAERTWIVGVEAPLFSVPKGPPIKVWRLE
jgi:hypothetical protein